MEIIKNIPEIIKGATNDFLGVNDDLKEKRLLICRKCLKREINPILGEVCGVCGCKLDWKLSLPYIGCPEGKFKAL